MNRVARAFRLVEVAVQDFGCVRRARLELGAGLNVIHGPNDLGKSTLIEAIRAALLLPAKSAAAKSYVPWGRDAVPEVSVVFQVRDGRYYRVNKRFGHSSTLEWSNDGREFQHDSAAREVDERLRDLLKWGVPAAGTGRGMPDSFLVRVLMASQPEVMSVLSSSFEADAEASGKTQISEALLSGALAAIAEDPLFRKTVERVTARVAEAYTPSGQKKRGRESPWVAVRDRINRATEELSELERRRDVSRAALERVRMLEAEHREAEQVVAEYGERLRLLERQAAEAEERLSLERRRDAAADALVSAERSVSEAEQARNTAEAMRAEVAMAGALMEQARSELQRARVADEECRARLAETTVAHGSQTQGAPLVARQADLRAMLEAERRQSEVLQRAFEHEQLLRRLQERLTASESVMHQVQAQEERLSQVLSQCEQEQEGLRALAGYWRWRDVRTQQLAQERQREQARDLRERAERLQQGASSMERSWRACQLPEPSALELLRELERELAVARAGLLVGLALELRPLGSGLSLRAAADGGRQECEPLVASRRLEASERLSIVIEGVVGMELLAGSAEARARASVLEARWAREASPLLARAGVADLGGLATLVQVREGEQHKVESERRQASELLARADVLESTQTTGDLAERLRRERDSFSDYDVEELEACAADYAREQEVALAMSQAERRRHTAEAELLAARARAASATAQAQATREQLEEAARSQALSRLELRGDLALAIQDNARRLETLGAELEVVARQLRQLEERRAAALAEAQSRVAEAQVLASARAGALEAAQSVLSQREQALAAQLVRLEWLERTTQAVDLAQARRDLADAGEALATFLGAHPRTETGESEVSEARRSLEGAQQSVITKRTELAEAKGGLSQLGGDSVEEDAAEAAGVLTQLRKEETELETDYEAWALLHSTLREVEQEQASHLGQVLGAPVQARFAELTGGRYAKVALNVDLRALGLEHQGGLRDVKALSQGTQEQLSTLFRLCLAERLESAVILDDHLAKTDSQKMTWFQNALLEVGLRTQVIVITCWPEHYGIPRLSSGSAEAGGQCLTRAIDAESIIERFP